MSCDCCQFPVGVHVYSRAGMGTAHGCAVAEFDGKVYGTVVDTHICENGEFTITSRVEAKIITNGDGECGDVETESNRDEEFDYGVETEVTSEYSDEVDLSAVLAAARGGIVYDAEIDGGRHVLAYGPAWFGDATGLPGPSATGTQGEESTATSVQMRYVLELYSSLEVSLFIQYRRTSDGVLTTQETVALSAATPDSGWVTAPTPSPDDGVEAAWVAVRIRPYTSGGPPLP